MKFTFTSEFQGFGSPKNTMEFEVEHIDDVLMYFQQFLKGAGYEIGINENIQIVNEYECSEPEDFYVATDIDAPMDEYYDSEPLVTLDDSYDFNDSYQTINLDIPKKKKGKK